jgi:putative ABC transport system permease protein
MPSERSFPAATFQTIYGHRNVGHLLIRPTDYRRAEIVKSEIYRVLGRKHKFHQSDVRALGIWDMIESEKQTALVFMGIQIFLGIVGGLTLLVAGIGVANIMYVVVRERTKEIGVKRALGARGGTSSPSSSPKPWCWRSSAVSSDWLISATIVNAVAGIPVKEGAMEFLGNPEISGVIALLTVGILGVIGLLAGVFPARKAAQGESGRVAPLGVSTVGSGKEEAGSGRFDAAPLSRHYSPFGFVLV